MSWGGELLIGLAILVGLVGVVVPVVPGGLLVWAAILVWSLEVQEAYAWVVLGLATVLIAVSQIVKWAVPEVRLRAAGVPRRTTVAGGLLGVVGFFVVPVVGLFLGFVLGVYLVERRRLGAHHRAWVSTKAALRAVGLSLLIELTGALLAAGAWVLAVATH